MEPRYGTPSALRLAWLATLLAAAPAAAQEPATTGPVPSPTAPATPGAGSPIPETQAHSHTGGQVASDAPDHHHHGWWGAVRYRSPGLAFALSLTPMPIDFGNLYAENIGWGITYTSVELAVGSGIVWIGADHMCHGNSCEEWSDGERTGMIALISGYIVVKLAAGTHASFAAQSFNEEHRSIAAPLVMPTTSGAVLGWQGTF